MKETFQDFVLDPLFMCINQAYMDYDDHCTVVVVIEYASKYTFRVMYFSHCLRHISTTKVWFFRFLVQEQMSGKIV
jgi:hypothetical protein